MYNHNNDTTATGHSPRDETETCSVQQHNQTCPEFYNIFLQGSRYYPNHTSFKTKEMFLCITNIGS